jgi:hypothetical protein
MNLPIRHPMQKYFLKKKLRNQPVSFNLLFTDFGNGIGPGFRGYLNVILK